MRHTSVETRSSTSDWNQSAGAANVNLTNSIDICLLEGVLARADQIKVRATFAQKRAGEEVDELHLQGAATFGSAHQRWEFDALASRHPLPALASSLDAHDCPANPCTAWSARACRLADAAECFPRGAAFLCPHRPLAPSAPRYSSSGAIYFDVHAVRKCSKWSVAPEVKRLQSNSVFFGSCADFGAHESASQ